MTLTIHGETPLNVMSAGPPKDIQRDAIVHISSAISNRGSHVGCPSSKQHSQKLKVEDAVSYLDQVRYKFSTEPQVYNKFLDIMKEFKSQSLDTHGVITRVVHLFKGHPELVIGFNTFLPSGYKIELLRTNSGDYSFNVSVDVSNISANTPNKVSSSSQSRVTRTTKLSNVSSLFNDSSANQIFDESRDNEVNSSFMQTFYMNDVSHALIQVESNKAVDRRTTHNKSVGFSVAVAYVNKVKHRLKEKPYKYEQFLKILKMYHKQQETAGKHQQTFTEVEVYSQMAKLFEDQEDLLIEFRKFLQNPPVHETLIVQNNSTSHDQSFDFDQAIYYLRKVKNRFSKIGKPQLYDCFLEILHIYREKLKLLEDNQRLCNTSVEAEVYSRKAEFYLRVATLFENHQDLLADFGHFLSDAVLHQTSFLTKNELPSGYYIEVPGPFCNMYISTNVDESL